MTNSRRRVGLLTMVGLPVCCVGGPALAQESPPVAADTAAPTARSEPTGEGDIVVTARRRDETLQSVPVTVSAVTGATLETRGITNLEGFARIVPQLFLAPSSGSFQGGAIGLRGISAGDGNVFGDQAVAFNIDGVQIARSTPRTLSEYDLEQIQVLKGPQALYFGKNSPGGVISIRTADPTSRLEAGARATYEFNAREIRGETFLSGPLTDDIGARVALSVARTEGWAKNITTGGTIYSPSDRRTPESREFNGRVTLKYGNGGPFKARLKFSYGNVRNDGPNANGQRVFCPLGTPQLGGPDDCTADDRVVRASIGPRPGTGGINTVTGATIVGVPQYGDGVPYSRTQQYLAGLELGYELSDTLALASTTGVYKTHFTALDNFNSADALFPFNPAAGAAAPSGMFFSYALLNIRELSEEMRLTSTFDGPLNFMLGGYYQDQKVVTETAAGANALNPIQLFPPARLRQDGTAYSGFGSLTYNITSQVELSGGARYSHERKTLTFFRLLPGTLPAAQGGATFVAGQQVPTLVPKRTFKNWSPEVTLTWRPTTRITAFASWRRGFLSGGFNGGATGTNVVTIPNRSYDQEVVEGFEAGLKTTLLDGRMRFNVSAFDYDIKGLQVTAVLPGPPPVQVINNAATAKSKGVEAEVTYAVAGGLSLRGAASYNDAHYSNFTTSPCFGGQTIGLGCNGTLVGAAFTTQNLSGDQLVRAPRWAGSAGASYDVKRASGDSMTFAVDGNYTSGFFTEALNAPGGHEDGYWLLDASGRYRMHNGVELALIGRNLTNKYYFSRSTAAPFTGGPSGVATSFQPDQTAFVNRGREIRVQLSVKF